MNDVVTLDSDTVITWVKTITNVNVLSSVRAGVGQFGTIDGVVISEVFLETP